MKNDGSEHQELPFNLLSVHSAVFVSVAFAATHSGQAWTDARRDARKVLKQAMNTDAKRLAAVVTALCATHPKADGSPPAGLLLAEPIIHEQVWKNVYEGIAGGDSDGVALLVSVLAQVAHMDDLKTSAFEEIFKRSQVPTAGKTLAAVNGAFKILRIGFRDVLIRYTDFSRSTAAINLLESEDVVKNVTLLMFSPVEALQEAAQSLVGLAYDVDGRLDCFRALLEHFPDASFSGLTGFLQLYSQYATTIPEACSLSQALARCLTDVIECLCSSPDGLLLQPRYLDVAGAVLQDKIPKWWQLMTGALCVIFARTPAWARFFENEEMVLWMRDALIFGRDLLAQRRIIEGAAVAFVQKDSAGAGAKASRRAATAVGRRMMDDLQQVLHELTKWLRLTDEELLHQSFALLETLLEGFRAAGARPLPETFARIKRHIEDARKADQGRLRSRLDSTRLVRLQEAIGAFDEDEDDEVEIVSHTLPPKKPVKEEVKVKAEPKHILRVSGDHKSKTKGPISNYFSATDSRKKRDDARPTVPARTTAAVASGSSRTLVPPRPVHRPLLKDESVKAKPVATKPEESSSSEGEESSDDEDAGAEKGLAALSKLQRTPTIKKPAERRQVKMVDITQNGRLVAANRLARRIDDARRTALRLKPDVSPLYRKLLAWNYDHNGPMPPGDQPQLTSVPGQFRDYAHFRSVLEPLLFLELWNELQESKEAPLEEYECRVMNRQYTDEYINLDVTVEGNPPREWALSDTDIVLLTNAGSKKRILAKAQSYRASHMGVNATLRFLPVGGDPGLHVGTCWGIAKVLRYVLPSSPRSLTNYSKLDDSDSRVCCSNGAPALRPPR